MAYLFPHGRWKPPLAVAPVDWAHPFVRTLRFGALFNAPFNAVPFWGRTAPRAVAGSFSGIGSGSNADGLCLTATAGTAIDFGVDPMPASQVTICLIRRRPATAGSIGTNFGLSDGGAASTARCQCHLPYTDNSVYFDFGGATAGTTRVTAALTWTTTLEKWIFIAGSRGMTLWRNGVKVATQATANPGRTPSTTLNFRLGNSVDAHEWNFFMVLDDQWDDALCRWWSAEPYAHLYGAQRRRTATAAAVARSYAFVGPSSGPGFAA